MVKCLDCEQEMLEAQGCTLKYVEGLREYARSPTASGTMHYIPECTRSEMRERLKYGEDGYTDDEEHVQCRDCGAKRSHLHHFGCDMERCPKCKGQMISCGCFAEVTPRDGGMNDGS